jgi:hypothetical protein
MSAFLGKDLQTEMRINKHVGLLVCTAHLTGVAGAEVMMTGADSTLIYPIASKWFERLGR